LRRFTSSKKLVIRRVWFADYSAAANIDTN
jgi:hypothetical protein